MHELRGHLGLLLRALVCLFSAASSHDLYVVVEPTSDQCLPLFGQFCCHLAALPYCCEEEVLAGELTLDVTGKQQSVWASLFDWKLRLWTDRSQKEAARHPFDSTAITRDTRIEDQGVLRFVVYSYLGHIVMRFLATGNGTLTITNGSISHIFLFEDKENLHHWLVHLYQHAADHRRWKQVAENR